MSHSRITVNVFTGLCAATSVACGAVYMLAAGAPRRYLLVNAAALTVGVVAASLVRRLALRDRRVAGALALGVGIVLLATAWFGVEISGASRWVVLAGVSLQPSLILLPLAIVLFASDRRWLSSIGLAIASLGLALQPDRAMAGTLAAGLGVLWLHRRESPVIVAAAVALCGWAVTLYADDGVAPVAFVEQVLEDAFAFHVLTGVAVAAGLVALLVPAGAVLRAPSGERAVLAVFGATWLAIIGFAIVGPYPTPLVGYGSSAILGYCLSGAVLPVPEGRVANEPDGGLGG